MFYFKNKEALPFSQVVRPKQAMVPFAVFTKLMQKDEISENKEELSSIKILRD